MAGEIRNLSTEPDVSPRPPLDPRAAELLAAGGLIPYLKRKYAVAGGRSSCNG